MTDDGCVVCGIVAGELGASVVHESPTVLAFMDIDPVTPGHVLVVPRAHLPDLAELDAHVAAIRTALGPSASGDA